MCYLCNVDFIHEEKQSLCCGRCEKLVCFGCSDLSTSQFVLLCSSGMSSNTSIHWYCKNCNEAAVKAVKSNIKNVIYTKY